jgi:hypothetical protein
MSLVFVDTVGLLALWNANDQWHGMARKGFADITNSEATLLTTTFVLLECGNAAARTPFRAEVNRLRDKLEQAETLIWPTEADRRQAWMGCVSTRGGRFSGRSGSRLLCRDAAAGHYQSVHQRPALSRRRI